MKCLKLFIIQTNYLVKFRAQVEVIQVLIQFHGFTSNIRQGTQTFCRDTQFQMSFGVIGGNYRLIMMKSQSDYFEGVVVVVAA